MNKHTDRSLASMSLYTPILYASDEARALYSDAAAYFNHPRMTKVKDVDGYSVYMAKTYCLISNECRYIVAFVGADAVDVGSVQALGAMEWICLQTRTLRDQHDLPPHNYHPRNTGPLSTPIVRVSSDDEASVYTCAKYPVTVSLLHTKTKTMHDYQARGTLVAALETYETIVTLND